jgi:hypothetical protein
VDSEARDRDKFPKKLGIIEIGAVFAKQFFNSAYAD